jgi:hypothetical protein
MRYVPSFRRSRVLSVGLILLMIGASCGGGSVASTTTQSSTIPLDPADEFLALRKSLAAIDGSYISVTPSGMFAVLITEVPGSAVPDYDEVMGGVATKRKVTLYKWDSTRWSDVSSVAPPIDEAQSAVEVTTRDYNMDGLNDFLISFFPYRSMRPFGRILTNISGQWTWANFMSPDGFLEQSSDALSYDDATKELWGQTFLEGRTSVIWVWDDLRGYFTATTDNSQGDSGSVER